MDNLPNWAQALFCVYFSSGLITFLFNAICFKEDYGYKGLILGCVLWARDNVKEDLNSAGVFIVTVFMVIITLPAIIIATIVGIIFQTGQIFWRGFKKIFAKKNYI